MSDVNAFIDNLGKDVTAIAVPRIGGLADDINAKVLNDYGPRVAAFANQLVKEIIDEQSATVRDFATTLIQDLSRRYRPELVGELRSRIVNNAVEVTGHGVKLDIKDRETGTSISSLDIPVAITIRLDELAVTLQDTVIRLDVVR